MEFSGKVVARLFGAAVGALLLTAASSAFAAASGDYSQSQASAGQQVYSQQCASCHGAQLQGQAGPALAGSQFASSLNYSKMSAPQLFDFIKTQMPANDPGSLSDQQYRQVLAYLLSKNGYPAGSKPLTADTLGQISLLPYPGSASQSTTSGSNPSSNP